MRTMINGQEAQWTPEISKKFLEVEKSWKEFHGPEGWQVIDANYFTPRPYQDEYCRGSNDEGFTYTLKGYYVWQTIINRKEN